MRSLIAISQDTWDCKDGEGALAIAPLAAVNAKTKKFFQPFVLLFTRHTTRVSQKAMECKNDPLMFVIHALNQENPPSAILLRIHVTQSRIERKLNNLRWALQTQRRLPGTQRFGSPFALWHHLAALSPRKSGK